MSRIGLVARAAAQQPLMRLSAVSRHPTWGRRSCGALRFALLGASIFVVLLLGGGLYLLSRSPGATGYAVPTHARDALRPGAVGSADELREVVQPLDDHAGVVALGSAANSSTSESPQSSGSPEAQAEVERIDKLYGGFVESCDAGSPLARTWARHLILRCIAVELGAQGRGELWDPVDSQPLPRVGPTEGQFLCGNQLFRYGKWEFPILEELRPVQSGETASEAIGAFANASISPELRARIEAEMSKATARLLALSSPGD